MLNPFEYLSIGKALGWGLAGTAFAVTLQTISIHPMKNDLSVVLTVLSSNVLLWLLLSALLYLSALVFSPSRIRAVDVFANNLFALLPSIVILGILSLLSRGIHSIAVEPRTLGEIAVHGVNYLFVLVLSVSMVWSMIWGCFAFCVSANIKGWRCIVIFVSCYVVVSVALQLLTEYL